MRRLWPLPGGIQPEEQKGQSTARPLSFAGLPQQLVLPLLRESGAPLTAIVQVGQRVLKGDVVARGLERRNPPLHASTSGTVVALAEHPVAHASAATAPCLVIEPDGLEQWRLRHPRSPASTDQQTLIDVVCEAGITGLGGAGFPTATKLAAAAHKPIDWLIVNGAECEPYITADDMLMRNRADEVIGGVEILQRIVEPAGATIIAIEDNKPEAIAAMTAAAAGKPIEVIAIPTRYPSGGERQLIYVLTGTEVPSGGLPADIGISCHNVGTAAAIYRAVVHDEPLVARITTVTGAACSEPRNVEVLLGTPISHLLTLAGCDVDVAARLVVGGPMMGFALGDAAAPVTATTNCILAATAGELPSGASEQPCIRCGACADVCPAGLLPQQLFWFARAGDLDQLETHHLRDCIDCGACAWVCPSAIPLVGYYRTGKAALAQRDREQAEAARAKRRFEARTARLERDAKERDERRRARAEALRQAGAAKADSPTDKAAAIRAAVERARARKHAASAPPSPSEEQP